MEDLLERIENSRSDADYFAARGDQDKALVMLSLADCAAIGELLTKAFGAVLVGKRDPALADNLALLGSAFEGAQED